MARPNNLLVYSFRPLTVDQTIGYFDYFSTPRTYRQSVQRGLASGRVDSGRLVPDEGQIEHFQKLVKAAVALQGTRTTPHERHLVITYGERTLDLGVVAIRTVSEGVRSIDRARIDGADLPSWAPGAHIDLYLGNGLIRQQSLCGPVDDSTTWRIGVLLEPASRGGSRLLHEDLCLGDKLTVVGPRNHFPLEKAPEQLLIAGGIVINRYCR